MASFETLYKTLEAPTAASADDITALPLNPSQSPWPDLKAECRPDAPGPAIDFLNAVITHEDAIAALKRLERNEAAGVDGIGQSASWMLLIYCSSRWYRQN